MCESTYTLYIFLGKVYSRQYTTTFQTLLFEDKKGMEKLLNLLRQKNQNMNFQVWEVIYSMKKMSMLFHTHEVSIVGKCITEVSGNKESAIRYKCRMRGQ